MNNMFPVWTLSSLILSYTLALPVFNNSRGSMETFPNGTEIMEYNKTRLMENMENFPNVLKTNQTRQSDKLSSWNLGCFFPSCALDNLVDKIQSGDEEAGMSTGDPWGPGKK